MRRLLFLLPLTLHAQQTGDELLDLALAKPDYSQMCDVATVPRSPKLPVYGIASFSEFQLDDGVVKKLRAAREKVVPLLTARIAAMNLDDLPAATETKFNDDYDAVIDSGIDPKVLNNLYFNLITRLNVTACLEPLLKLEKDLALRLEQNHADPEKNPLPGHRLTGGFMVEDGLWKNRINAEDSDEEPSRNFSRRRRPRPCGSMPS